MNNISFKGTYHINFEINNGGYQKLQQLSKFNSKIKEKAPDEFQQKATAESKIVKGRYVIPDEYDIDLENFCVQKGIQYKKLTKEELFSEYGIKARTIIPKDVESEGLKIVNVKTQKFNDAYEEYGFAYIGDKNDKDVIRGREKFIKFLKTGDPIEVSTVYLDEENGKLCVNFLDGRHRYATLRDFGFNSIPVCMNEKSIEIAKKYDLIDNS